MNKSFVFIALFFLLLPFYSCSDRYGSEVKQINVERIELMPNMPQPYKIIDWKQKPGILMTMSLISMPPSGRHYDLAG